MSDALFFGHGLNVVDAKSRLSIPADLRATLTARGSEREVLIGPAHGDRPCLIAHDKGESLRVRERFMARHGADNSEAVQRENIELSGFMQKLNIDEAGRIVLTPLLKHQGGLGSHVWFIAGFDYFELWDPWTFLEQPGLKRPHRDAVVFNLQARGLPLERPA